MITAVEQANAAWLTDILQKAGVLSKGVVVDVNLRPNDAFNSSIAHLEIFYSEDAAVTTPKNLLLKLNHEEDGAFEVAFYQLAMSESAQLPMLVRCYKAKYSPLSGDSYILLEDVSPTHLATPITRQQILSGESVPPAIYLTKIVDTLAQFHAYWWEHPQLNKAAEVTQVKWWFRNKTHFAKHIQKREGELKKFMENVGEGFPAEMRQLYINVLRQLPLLWQTHLEQRVTHIKNLTFTNGDCYFNQFLCPRDNVSDQTYMVDFQDASVCFGAIDLVYLLAAFWTPTQRYEQKREENLLWRYLQRLQINGVSGYDWDDLLNDYRLMLTLIIFVPVWDQTTGAAKNYWWPKMQCLIAAFQDLNCMQLFEK